MCSGRGLVPTGLALALPEGYAGFVQPRSGLAMRHGVTCLNTPGLIDAGYRDEVKVLLVNTDPDAAAVAFAIAARDGNPLHGRALLHGAAVLDQLRDVELWLARGRTGDGSEDWRPDRLLTGLLETDGGYLEPALT